jgi:photosystem II stability/assembly factor-like uncharacterized protein
MKTFIISLLTWFLLSSSNSILLSQSGWVKQSVNTISGLNAVHFINDNTGWVVGDSAVVCRTTNSGANWLKSTVPPTGGRILRSVYFKNQNTGIIGGCDYGNVNGFALRTTDGGIQWTQTDFSGVPYDLFSFGSDTIWSSRHNGNVMKSTNMGLTWVSTFVHTNLELYTVFFVDNLTGWTGGAVFGGYAYIYKTTNGGSSWFNQIINQTDHFFSICFINNTTGFASTLGGNVFETNDAGINWIPRVTGAGNTLFEVRFPGANIGYVTGMYKSLLKTTNQGANWVQQVLPSEIAPNVLFTSLCFRDVNTGWAIGHYGTILKTTNGGAIGIESISTITPADFSLSQNYPNPFNPTTTIEFALPKTTNLKIVIFDSMGKEIETVADMSLQSGSYRLKYDASKLSSGVYFYRLITKSFSQTRKFILIK